MQDDSAELSLLTKFKISDSIEIFYTNFSFGGSKII